MILNSFASNFSPHFSHNSSPSLLDSPWYILGASVQGRSHERLAIPGQDAHAWATLPQDAIVIAVADGAGSAAHSGQGSTIATQAAIEFVQTFAQEQPQDFATLIEARGDRAHLDRALAVHDSCQNEKQNSNQNRDEHNDQCGGQCSNQCDEPHRNVQQNDRLNHYALNLFNYTQSTLKNTANQAGWELSDLATTLIVILATPHQTIAWQVGDGVAIGQQNHVLIALTQPDQGEYVNETIFLTSEAAAEAIQIQRFLGGMTHLAVLTDGLQRLALQFPSQQPYRPFFQPLFQFLEQVTESAVKTAKSTTENTIKNTATNIDQNTQDMANLPLENTIKNTTKSKTESPAEIIKKTAIAQLTAFLGSAKVRDRTDDDVTLVLAYQNPKLSKT